MGEDEGARNQDTSHVVTGGCRELVEAPRERAGSEYENEGVAEGRGGGGGEKVGRMVGVAADSISVRELRYAN